MENKSQSTAQQLASQTTNKQVNPVTNQNKKAQVNQVISEASSKKNQLRQQLLSMQFQPALVETAINATDQLDKAIELIISILEQEDVKKLGSQDTIQLVLLVRMDLKMGMGKIAAQCAHATLKAFIQGRNQAQNDDNYSLTFIRWLETGQQKVAFKIQSEQQLYNLLGQAKSAGINTCYIRDAGRTQIAAGSTTVGAMGPCSSLKIYELIKHLRRL